MFLSQIHKLFTTITRRNFAISRCLVLHPVSIPNAGPEAELCFAEEAIGLAKRLGWNILNPQLGSQKQYKDHPFETVKSKEDAAKVFYNENIVDGDYVYTPTHQGVYYQGGVIVNLAESTDEDGDIHDEWRDKNLRESLAKSSLIKVKKVSGSTYFSKGKMIEIGEEIKRLEAEIVFINAILTPIQQTKLEKRWNDILMNRMYKVRKYLLKSYSRPTGEPTDVDTMTASGSEFENLPSPVHQVKVVDRFGVILQIFSQRAQSREAKIQLELAWLNHIKLQKI